jgi:hypothetical protein
MGKREGIRLAAPGAHTRDESPPVAAANCGRSDAIPRPNSDSASSNDNGSDS